MNEDFESYKIEDEEPEEKRYTMWRLAPRVFVAPSTGWEKVKMHGPSPDLAVIRFLLPFSLMAGGSVFFRLLYPGQHTFTDLLVNAVIAFFSFFLGYYIALVLQKIFLPKEDKDFPSSKYGKLLTITGVSTLAIYYVLGQALPMFDFIIEFFPLWTIFLTYKGLRAVELKTDKWTYALGVICIVIISSPVLAEWFFSLFA